jgi:hypothetical protein
MGWDPADRPLPLGTIQALAHAACVQGLPSLDWSGLQLGDSGVDVLVRTLAAGMGASAVTSLDLRNNDLSTLPLELHRLEKLTELHFEEGNPGLDPALGKVRLPAQSHRIEHRTGFERGN